MSTTGRDQQAAPSTTGRVIHWARLYDAASWLMSLGQGGRMSRDIVETAGIRPGEKVLDVGCGTGAQTLPAAQRAGPGNVHGIDASPEMIEVARGKAARLGLDIDFRVAAIEDIPFAADQFDVAISGFMLHHLPDDLKRRGFAEVYRVLKPRGRFLAVDMASHRGSLLGHVIRLFGHGHSAEAVAGMKEMLQEPGFQDVKELEKKQRELVFLEARKP